LSPAFARLREAYGREESIARKFTEKFLHLHHTGRANKKRAARIRERPVSGNAFLRIDQTS
jgi:hypothetical protein